MHGDIVDQGIIPFFSMVRVSNACIK